MSLFVSAGSRARAVLRGVYARLMSASGRGELGRLVKLARNVVRQEACADGLAERGVLPVVSWPMVLDGVRSLVDAGVADAGVLAGVEGLAGLSV